MITTAIQPVKTEVSEMYALLTPNGEAQKDNDDDDDASLHFPDLFPDPGDYGEPDDDDTDLWV